MRQVHRSKQPSEITTVWLSPSEVTIQSRGHAERKQRDAQTHGVWYTHVARRHITSFDAWSTDRRSSAALGVVGREGLLVLWLQHRNRRPRLVPHQVRTARGHAVDERRRHAKRHAACGHSSDVTHGGQRHAECGRGAGAINHSMTKAMGDEKRPRRRQTETTTIEAARS